MSVFALRPHPLPLAADMICEQPLIGLGETLQHPPKAGLLVAFLDWTNLIKKFDIGVKVVYAIYYL